MSDGDAKSVPLEAPKKRQKVRDTSQELSGPNVLNVATFPDGYPCPHRGPVIPAAELARRMYEDLKAIYTKFLSADGWHVDYDGLRRSEEMVAMVQTMAALQYLDLGQLSIPARTALCLNLYNLLCIHAVLHQVPPGKTTNDVQDFFTHNSYVIGGDKYCLDDIEHGLVRGDRALSKTGNHFSPDDPRKRFSLPFDLRAHAAMVCGGKGCPVIRLYSSTNVHKELDEAMTGFVMRDTTIDVAHRGVTTSKIWEWYDTDFGADNRERLQCMHTYSTGEVKAQLATLLADGGEIHLVFLPYQWALNGTLTSRV